eukprot:c4560_g1_i1.p1 GENE.c4560_g1_i1~~c4560_g1_i1.p1  ORF type:complete len:184 (-),score=43.29 c4560_g1_i1:310-861(-)
MGCGHGLAGIFARVHNHAALVHFQDFNVGVLTNVTIPTCIANGLTNSTPTATTTTNTNTTSSNSSLFVSGDWSSIAKQHNPPALPLSYYGVILSVETVYDRTNFPAVSLFLESFLRPETGIAVVAAKNYYFGVGGGTTEFSAYMSDRPCQSQAGWRWEVKREAKFEDGMSNTRELLLLRMVKA